MTNKAVLICMISAALMPAYMSVQAQTYSDKYEQFRKQVYEQHSQFREECNSRYADFLRASWSRYKANSPIPRPKDTRPVPPRPYGGVRDKPVSVEPVNVSPVEPLPQPLPVAPVKEVPEMEEARFVTDFYGAECRIRLPGFAKRTIDDSRPVSIAEGWKKLSGVKMNNALRDCLETRLRYNLCDWAYLEFLQKLASEYCGGGNSATMLAAYLFCQSGYQMRLADDNGRLVMLYGSRHAIYGKPYFVADATKFYPYGQTSESLKICNVPFEGETPLSLLIEKEQLLGDSLSAIRSISSRDYSGVSAEAAVPTGLISFYSTYPTSAIGDNPLTRWAIYANVPMAGKAAGRLYPALRKAVVGLSARQSAERLLNWVQTGFVYEYDDKVWGHDRAFFAEETLYYPYCDCEDRSILFSRLVRDLLNLDVALIYYPGHLATAVCFDEDVEGDAMVIGGRRFVVCDPTYIGAPVGSQMPGLEYDKARAILLSR